MVQLSHPYLTTGKTIALIIWTFADKIMSLLYNKASSFLIAFLPRRKHLLISQLQSPSAVTLEPKKNKVSHCFHCFPIYLSWSDGTGCHDLYFLNVEFQASFKVEYQTTLSASWEICMQVKKQQLEMNMEQTGSKLGKEYVKAVYCNLTYLYHMQSISWEMLAWMKHKLESRLLGEISITSDTQMIPPLWQKVKRD